MILTNKKSALRDCGNAVSNFFIGIAACEKVAAMSSRFVFQGVKGIDAFSVLAQLPNNVRRAYYAVRAYA